MNAVGIDISSRKSTVAVLRPLGEVVRFCYFHFTTDKRVCLYRIKIQHYY